MRMDDIDTIIRSSLDAAVENGYEEQLMVMSTAEIVLDIVEQTGEDILEHFSLAEQAVEEWMRDKGWLY